MKKFLLMLVFVVSCAVFTSCSSDAEKAAKYTFESEQADWDGDDEKSDQLAAKAAKILDKNKGDKEFRKEYKKALKALRDKEEEKESNKKSSKKSFFSFDDDDDDD